MTALARTLRGWRTSLASITTYWQSLRPLAQVGWSWLWVQALIVDVELELTLQGVNDWAPGSPNAAPDALPLLGNSRGLIQGEAETNDHFAQRLRNWRTNGLFVAPPATPQVGSQIGRAEVLAQQIQQYLGNTPTVRVIERIFSTSGATMANYVTANPDGSTSVQVAAWDWDSVSGFTGSAEDGSYTGASAFPLWQSGHVYALADQIITTDANGFVYKVSATAGTHTSGTTQPAFPEQVGLSVIDNPGTNQVTWLCVAHAPGFTRSFWSDFWIVVYPCEWPVTGTQLTALVPIWGSTTVGLGHAVPVAARDAILRIVGQWKGAHCFCRAIIWSYDATLFDPASPAAAGDPNGQWGPLFNRTGEADGRVRYWEGFES